MENVIESACDNLIANVDQLASLLAQSQADPKLDLADPIASARQGVAIARKELATKLRKPITHRGRKFSRDKTGQVHACRVEPGKISPLGRIGYPLARMTDGPRYATMADCTRGKN